MVAVLTLAGTLEHARLSGVLSPTMVNGLPKLRSLRISASNISGTIPTEVGLLTKLEYLCARPLSPTPTTHHTAHHHALIALAGT